MGDLTEQPCPPRVQMESNTHTRHLDLASLAGARQRDVSVYLSGFCKSSARQRSVKSTPSLASGVTPATGSVIAHSDELDRSDVSYSCPALTGAF